jgi:hypothetical protein
MFSDDDLKSLFLDLDLFPTDDITAIKQYLDRQNGNPFNMFYTTMLGVKRMKTVDQEQVTALIDDTSVLDIAILALKAGRVDVMKRAVGAPCLDKPEHLLGERCVFENPECLDALLARLTPEVLNADSGDGFWRMAHWEKAIHGHGLGQKHTVEHYLDVILGQKHTVEHYLDVILPRLHAAGADLMDDRFEGIIPQERQPFAPELPNGHVALDAYRRRVLAEQLHAIADAEAPALAPPRARARL